MSELETLKADIKKLSAKATQAKMETCQRSYRSTGTR